MTSRNDTKRVAGIGRVDCRNVLDLMDLRSVDVRNMPDSHYAAIQSALPTATELRTNKWQRRCAQAHVGNA